MSDALLLRLWQRHGYIFKSKRIVDDTTGVWLFFGIMRSTIEPQAVLGQEQLSAQLPDQTLMS